MFRTANVKALIHRLVQALLCTINYFELLFSSNCLYLTQKLKRAKNNNHGESPPHEPAVANDHLLLK